ncbi:unnamed protein product [Acanthoscelides obtectus]|uniref:Uncharacterized protein n=1 Tax=Acanthoscelides obtectus TaxID=200917 RepID=A0A9P0MAD9_ACAOB|nr:unnamed protein product [Acanthoscelides obtectus]CAK1661152.1 hypothetical protein AOBTE_LOCUS22478 [Acanthoscelides obtectus]
MNSQNFFLGPPNPKHSTRRCVSMVMKEMLTKSNLPDFGRISSLRVGAQRQAAWWKRQ